MKRKLIILGLVVIVLLSIALPAHAESQDAVYYTWENIDQFIDWYHEQGFVMATDIMEASTEAGVTTITYRKATCLDYALMIQREAMKQGKMVSIAMSGGAGTYYDQAVSLPYHAGNLVIVPLATYWVEPQPDKFRVIRLCGIEIIR